MREERVISLEVFHCIAEAGGVTQPLKARDYKDPLVVMYELSTSDRTSDGKRISEARNTGSDE